MSNTSSPSSSSSSPLSSPLSSLSLSTATTIPLFLSPVTATNPSNFLRVYQQRHSSQCAPHYHFHRMTSTTTVSPPPPPSSIATPKLSLTSSHNSQPITDQGLPLTYDSRAIDDYWMSRSGITILRFFEIALRLTPWLISLILDKLLSRTSSKTTTLRASQLREHLTSLGPTFIKLGQALSVRPDLIGPDAMKELQLLCDAVPCFDSGIAMQLIEEELGKKISDIYGNISERPVSGASLGQVYKARLKKNGREVAVKVQRPDMLKKVSLDMYVLDKVAGFAELLKSLVVNYDVNYRSLLREWAKGTWKELDYVNEAANSKVFKRVVGEGVPEVYVPDVYDEFTTRKVLTMEWVNGTKLAESSAGDVKNLVAVGVECFLYQLLSAGFFHSDPHPGNLLRTDDGRLCVIDFGLMASVDKGQTDGMVAAIIHLVNHDWKRVVEDFIALEFLPSSVDKSKIEPVLAAILAQALQGGGAKAINFQSLSAELAAVTFKFPFRIPPYFALIIRALGVLEGIALSADPKFKLIMESFPFVSRLILRDDSPKLRESLRQILYKDGVFSATRLRVLLDSTQGILGEGEAFVDFDTPTHNPTAASWALNLLFSENGAILRDIISEELANGIDVWVRDSYARVASLFQMSIPTPVRALISTTQRMNPLLPQFYLGTPTENFALPPVSEEDQRHLDNLRDLVQFLMDKDNGGIGMDGLIRMMPDILPKTKVLGRMIVGKMSEKYTKRFFEDLVRANGEVIGNRRRVNLPWAGNGVQ